ncbi:uncharacterized protein BO80DRAFT_228123 [Aspergillus ibericus CBS 121593]|uniref:Uncharacterized protein n=1 Tax=Aspergillus ibericus CBS 121593 TaxID=1448316 RepID=A0A395GLV4_9EURO|nr:hypothetical protein BO80DRAFT_228123 [Aspergillus ibericus CBS 121593]RAK96364.1 hypothetical protein BO80DRAFT_228123 [Aspergillus ibericus CBS 121593]
MTANRRLPSGKAVRSGWLACLVTDWVASRHGSARKRIRRSRGKSAKPATGFHPPSRRLSFVPPFAVASSGRSSSAEVRLTRPESGNMPSSLIAFHWGLPFSFLRSKIVSPSNLGRGIILQFTQCTAWASSLYRLHPARMPIVS